MGGRTLEINVCIAITGEICTCTTIYIVRAMEMYTHILIYTSRRKAKRKSYRLGDTGTFTLRG